MMNKSMQKDSTKSNLVHGVSYENAATDDGEKLLVEKLKSAMDNDKVYLDAGLTIERLAKIVGTSKSVLSHLINNGLNQNYATYISSYRIREALQLLSNEKYHKYKIEAIGEMCGFANRQVFHATFKKEMGITPTHFRNISKSKTDNSTLHELIF